MASEDDSEFVDKLRSLSFSRPAHRAPKVTTDVHDSHTVDITEHWHDRQDITVKPQTLKIKPKGTVHGA